MEKYKLTDEQIEILRTVAERIAATFEAVWEAVKEFLQRVEMAFSSPVNLIDELMKKENELHPKCIFGSIVHTKGKAFKSQVQLNKPRFIQARSRL